MLSIAKQTTPPPQDAVPVYDARDLTHGGTLARIKLDDQLYTLRVTRAGKLILTK
jgi:hemin uptake protein HemP